MRRVIRNKASGMFLTAKGVWTKSVARAQSFPSLESVILEEQKLNLTGAEVILMMAETPGKFDIVLPLEPPSSLALLPSLASRDTPSA